MSLLQRRARSLLWLAAGLLAATAAWADDAATEPVRLRIVLLRHSVRSPTKAPQELGVYAAQAWPEWPVEPGQLTPHGVDVMRALGGWHRRQLDADGLVGAGCDAVPAIRIVSDSTPRNHASAAALAAGLMPGCAAARSRPARPIRCSAACARRSPGKAAPRPSTRPASCPR